METNRLKILTICTSSSDASYFSKIISEALPGTEVYIAQDGLHGVQLAKIKEPDVILIDISITDTDSLKVSRILRRIKTYI